MAKRKPDAPLAGVTEAVEGPVEALSAGESVPVHIVKDGDSYASIAALYNKTGESNYEYAKALILKNKNKALRARETVIL